MSSSSRDDCDTGSKFAQFCRTNRRGLHDHLNSEKTVRYYHFDCLVGGIESWSQVHRQDELYYCLKEGLLEQFTWGRSGAKFVIRERTENYHNHLIQGARASQLVSPRLSNIDLFDMQKLRKSLPLTLNLFSCLPPSSAMSCGLGWVL